MPTTQPVVPTTQPVTGPQPVYCGAGFNGLAIVAITTQGSAACSTATSVTNEYAAHSADWGPGFSVAVTADDGSVWTCQEQLGDPNPYQECVNQQNPAEKVRLSS
ncbi:hypothetical protein [Nocardia sp. NPDC020380]|uniref:hypothetical protein n=1 Tax=Nocardia sp. NPDC020380 TaxID=3364309 RepID=UPI0037B45AB3